MRDFTHIDERGQARMVDVSHKKNSKREAVAAGRVNMQPDTVARIASGGMKKGDVLGAARIAGIMAAKNTPQLIPLCHSVPLDSVKVELTPSAEESCVHIRATACCTHKTGVEMEALTAVSVAALTLYDMCKAVDKRMQIANIHLQSKRGGTSGDFDWTKGQDQPDGV